MFGYVVHLPDDPRSTEMDVYDVVDQRCEVRGAEELEGVGRAKAGEPVDVGPDSDGTFVGVGRVDLGDEIGEGLEERE